MAALRQLGPWQLLLPRTTFTFTTSTQEMIASGALANVLVHFETVLLAAPPHPVLAMRERSSVKTPMVPHHSVDVLAAFPVL